MSDMARYIEKEPLCAWLENIGVSEYIIKSIENEDKFPTADVAPKSEVERLEKEIERLRLIIKKKVDEYYR